jgi:hypothetical protein
MCIKTSNSNIQIAIFLKFSFGYKIIKKKKNNLRGASVNPICNENEGIISTLYLKSLVIKF